MSSNIFNVVDFMSFSKIMFMVVIIVALLIFGLSTIKIIKNTQKKNNNKKAPTIVTEATVVTKRAQNIFMNNSASSTIYYVTFQILGGDRIELNLSGQDYGMLADGDCGKLSYKGTMFIDFIRK